MKQWSLSIAALLLALPLTTGRAAAQDEVKAVAQAVGDQDPLAISWADSADGKVSLDDAMSEQVHSLFAGVQYILTEDGRLLLGHLKGTDFTLIVPQAAQIRNETDTYFVAHVRNSERTLFLDGSITRFRDDPSKGYAEFTLLLLGSQGTSFSTHIEQNLTFAASTTNPEPAPDAGTRPGTRQ